MTGNENEKKKHREKEEIRRTDREAQEVERKDIQIEEKILRQHGGEHPFETLAEEEGHVNASSASLTQKTFTPATAS